MKLRVVSWNMQKAFQAAAQHERAWHYLCALDPDIALLQEAKPPEWIRAKFQCVHREKVRQWCSVIAGQNVTIEPIIPAAGSVLANFFDGYVVSARATLSNGRSVRLASVHTPASAVKPEGLAGLDPGPIPRPSRTDIWHNDLAYWALQKELEGSTFLVSGDWNTARLFDKFPKIYGGGSTDFFDRAIKDGWVECLRLFHEEEQRTFFKPNNGPYELDHAFCSKDLRTAITSCDVDAHAAEVLGLSDHAPIVMEFDF